MDLVDAATERAGHEKGVPIALFIDDGQHVHPILDDLIKYHRNIHLIVATSYFFPFAILSSLVLERTECH